MEIDIPHCGDTIQEKESGSLFKVQKVKRNKDTHRFEATLLQLGVENPQPRLLEFQDVSRDYEYPEAE